jgi:hypothetical protein
VIYGGKYSHLLRVLQGMVLGHWKVSLEREAIANGKAGTHQRFFLFLFSFCAVVVTYLANGGWSLQILTNMALSSHHVVAINCAKQNLWNSMHEQERFVA